MVFLKYYYEIVNFKSPLRFRYSFNCQGT